MLACIDLDNKTVRTGKVINLPKKKLIASLSCLIVIILLLGVKRYWDVTPWRCKLTPQTTVLPVGEELLLVAHRLAVDQVDIPWLMLGAKVKSANKEKRFSDAKWLKLSDH